MKFKAKMEPARDGHIPDAVIRLADRLGCGRHRDVAAVELSQVGQMRQHKAAAWMAFKARQTIQLKRCAFEWNARTGPFKAIHVKDAFDGEHGDLSVALWGVLPIMRAPRSPEIDRGELLRYLAELAWAPDAILANTDLHWRVEDERHLVVSTGGKSRRGELRLTLDQEGLIVEVFAKDRPRAVGKAFETSPWRGVFSKHERRQGRIVPSHAEVGWVSNASYEVVWRGELTDWRVT